MKNPLKRKSELNQMKKKLKSKDNQAVYQSINSSNSATKQTQ